MAKQFDSKIHIAQWRMKAYSVLPSVHQCLTLDGNSTRIHACNYKVCIWNNTYTVIYCYRKVVLPVLYLDCHVGQHVRSKVNL